MSARVSAAALVVVLAIGPAAADDPKPDWPGERLPLPLVARTPQELPLKAEAERLYLQFNLLAGGKYAFDRGDYGTAVKKWEALLRSSDVTPEARAAVTPLLAEARRKQTGAASDEEKPLASGEVPDARAASPAPARASDGTVSVSGTVTGGGSLGPGAAVLWLRRLDGPTPHPRAGRRRVISQRGKRFVPRVLAVPVGTTVDFRNDDDFYHNVFSLSDGPAFDTGLYPAHEAHGQRFDKPGPIELLCNIHAEMQGYVYVVDSPWYAQPRAGGTFAIHGVTPGKYELIAWHEAAANLVRQPITVAAGGARDVNVRIPADRDPVATRPDKYGRPRQVQLGY